MTSGSVSKIAPSVMPPNLQILKDVVESAASVKLADLCLDHNQFSCFPFFFNSIGLQNKKTSGKNP